MKYIRNRTSLTENDGEYSYKLILDDVNAPSIRYANGGEVWYKEGEIHRDDGPAVTLISSKGKNIFWYNNGKYHRENGPAVILHNGKIKEWYINGVRQT